MRKAVVLGATSGIGRAIAEMLIRDGWTVGIGSRRTELLEELRKSAPDRVFVEPLDVRESTADEGLLRLAERLGGMDLFFYAPGIGKQNADLDPGIELATVETNALGFTRMVGAAYRHMAEHGGGHIAVVSSIAGVRGSPRRPPTPRRRPCSTITSRPSRSSPCPRRRGNLHRDPPGLHRH